VRALLKQSADDGVAAHPLRRAAVY